MNADYDALFQRIKQDPNVIERIGPVTIGTRRNDDASTIYPKVTPKELEAARKALQKATANKAKHQLPRWLKSCSRPPGTLAISLAGAGLIFIAFIFFAPNYKKPPQKSSTQNAKD